MPSECKILNTTALDFVPQTQSDFMDGPPRTKPIWKIPLHDLDQRSARPRPANLL